MPNAFTTLGPSVEPPITVPVRATVAVIRAMPISVVGVLFGIARKGSDIVQHRCREQHILFTSQSPLPVCPHGHFG
jgi:hypothetical protein